MKKFLNEKFELYKKSGLGIVIFSLILYFLFMSEQLTNTFDGLWHYNYYYSGGHELGTGRWLWPFFDKLQFGIHTDPVQTILVLSFFILGTFVVLDLFNITNSIKAFMYGAMIMSSVVISVALSYKYMSLAYAVAFFLSVLSFYILVKVNNKYVSMILSALCIACTMGLYQAYLGCTCLLALIYGISLLKKKESNIKEIGIYALRVLVTLIVGGILYIILLNLNLWIFNASLNNYNGADEVSLIEIIRNMPQTVPRSYKYFGEFLFGDLLKDNALDKYGLPYLITACEILMFIVYGISIVKDNVVKVVIYILAILLIPLGANVCVVLAPQTGGMIIQATGGMQLILPVLFMLFANIFDRKKIFSVIATVITVLIIYGNFVQVYIDENAMWEGKRASVSMANCMMSDLSSGGALSKDCEYFFIGCPKWNETFGVSELYNEANSYAKFGGFWLENNMMCASYEGLFNKIMGVNIRMSGDMYEEMAYAPLFETMPSYPEPGYFVRWENVVIVKVSEPVQSILILWLINQVVLLDKIT